MLIDNVSNVVTVQTPSMLSYYYGMPKTCLTSIMEAIKPYIILERTNVDMHPKGLKWTTIRNPFARLYSCWCDKVGDNPRRTQFILGDWIDEGVSFPEFVDMAVACPDNQADPHFAGQCWLMNNGNFSPEVVLRCEIIQQRWQWFSRSIGISSSLPELNVTRNDILDHDSHVHAYTKTIQEKIVGRYDEDFCSFRYSKICCM